MTIKELLKNQLNTLNYYTEFLQIIPGVQEPDCSKLFQSKIDLIQAISECDAQQQVIAELKAELEQHDDQITNIEIVNQEILAVADAKFNRLVDENNGLKAMVNALTSKANAWERVWGELENHPLIRAVAASHGLSGNCSCASILLDAFEQACEALEDNQEELASVKADAVSDAVQKFRYEFEGPRDTDSIETFFDEIEKQLREQK
jgi:ClpP class serine protease